MIFGELIREMSNLVTFVFPRGRHQSPDRVYACPLSFSKKPTEIPMGY